MKHKMLGVTLIELMVVIVVISILASIAVPSYRSYLLRAQRTEGTGALLQIQQAQEKYFLQNNRYATNPELILTPANGGLGLTNVTPNNRYNVDLFNITATTYTARATTRAGGGQTDDNAHCQIFTIDQQGARTSTPDPITTCWK